jgi:hypothetical protein
MKQRRQAMPVELSGVDELRKALKQYAPDLDKQLKKDLQAATQSVVNAARGFVPAQPPLSNWGRDGGNFPTYNAATIRNGIRLSTARSKINKNGFASSVRIVNANAAGSIYETAGRKNPNGQPTFQRVGRVYRTSGTEDYPTADFQLNYFLPPKGNRKGFNNSANPNAGKQFVDAANATGVLVNAKPRTAGQRGQVSRKFTGRLIYRAWAEDNGKTQAAVVQAIMKTNDLFVSKTSGIATRGVRKVA